MGSTGTATWLIAYVHNMIVEPRKLVSARTLPLLNGSPSGSHVLCRRFGDPEA